MSYYAWPASALGPSEMSMLFHGRKAHPQQTTIAALLADAVRRVYGGNRSTAVRPENLPKNEVRR